jgi:radial spoke head protein 1
MEKKSLMWFCFAIGNWVKDQRCGFGKYTYVNADSYEGEWQDHLRHGQGTYTYSQTGTKYGKTKSH